MKSISVVSLVLCLQLFYGAEADIGVGAGVGVGVGPIEVGAGAGVGVGKGGIVVGGGAGVGVGGTGIAVGGVLGLGGSGASKRKCKVQLKASGNADSNLNKADMSHIIIDGKEIFHTTHTSNNGRGINVVVLNRDTCTGADYTTYDMYADKAAGDRLGRYLGGLAKGTIVLGVTSDTAWNIDPAKATLKSLGVNVDNIAFHDKFLFVIQKGTLPAIKVQLSLKGEPSIEYEHTF